MRRYPLARSPVYVTSKAAIAGFTRRRGAVRSVWHRHLNVMRTARTTAIPLKRFGEAWDVAAASVFLASDEAQYISGAELMVDGGLTSVAATATISASPPAQPANS